MISSTPVSGKPQISKFQRQIKDKTKYKSKAGDCGSCLAALLWLADHPGRSHGILGVGTGRQRYLTLCECQELHRSCSKVSGHHTQGGVWGRWPGTAGSEGRGRGWVPGPPPARFPQAAGRGRARASGRRRRGGRRAGGAGAGPEGELEQLLGWLRPGADGRGPF